MCNIRKDIAESKIEGVTGEMTVKEYIEELGINHFFAMKRGDEKTMKKIGDEISALYRLIENMENIENETKE